MLFNSLNLSKELVDALDKKGYKEASPIQEQVIPLIAAGNDILASAQTGTGKTAGFVLPLLQLIQNTPINDKSIKGLILTPTRELAAQVADSIKVYGSNLDIKTIVLYGGVSINPQIYKLRKGVDIVVATPGRLLDHLRQKTIKLNAVKVFTLDEADRMLDMGFIKDIQKIMKHLPTKRQNLLFSATFSKEIRSLANSLMNNPRVIEVARPNSTVDKVKQLVLPVDKQRKRELLSFQIDMGEWEQVLVFTRTKHMANRLTEKLNDDGISSVAFHGNKSQAARINALNKFKAREVRVMVATDVAARGIDIDALPYVINYELPYLPEDYIHRIGRTARAGQDGFAISLVCIDEEKLLRGIEKLVGQNIEKQIIQGFEVDPRIVAEPIRKGNKPIKRNRENFKKNRNKKHPSKRWSKRKSQKK
ncbi:MAG: DEAD/DEAH box helicase [Woeseiaceae bacterium]|nr:DEAD/DEAH box helicase [Woeseiaceae bacterium]MDG1865130.1 DEAD/DEAH box helicase [Woeseiaceae bacterium]